MKNNKDKIYRLIRETNKLHGLRRFNQPTKCIEKIDSYSKIIFEGEKVIIFIADFADEALWWQRNRLLSAQTTLTAPVFIIKWWS